jgi:AsmA protein
MGKVLKIIGIVVGIVILLCIIATVAVVTLVNPNKYKSQISAAVYKNTGRQLTINGDIKWDFFPRLGLRLSQINLANAAGFGQQPFAQMGKLDIKVQILPLLSGHLNFNKIVLQDVTLNLIRNQQGKTNWEDLLANHAANPNSSPSSSASTPKKLAFTISSIVINNATITWQDQQTGQSIILKQLQLNSTGIGLNRSFPIYIQFNFNSNRPALQFQLAANSHIQLMPQTNYYTFKNLNIQGLWFGPNYPDGKLPFNLNADLVLNGQQQTLQLNNLSAQIANLPLKGEFTVQKYSQNPVVQGVFAIPSFSPRQLLTALGQDKNIHFASDNVMQNAAAIGKLQWSDKTLHLDNFQTKLDDMQLSGTLTIAPMKGETTIQSDLALNQFYPDRYMLVTTSSTTAKQQDTKPISTTSNQQQSPIAALLAIPKGLNILGSLRIGQFRFKNITATNVNLQYILQRAMLKLAPVTADLYNGKSLIQFVADAKAATPQITLNSTLTNIQVGTLLKDLMPNSKTQLTGTSNITSRLQTQGQNKNAWLNNLNGDTNFSITNGTIANLDLGKQIYNALQLVIKHGMPTQTETNQIHFTTLTGTLQIQHGVINNNDLSLKSDSLQVAGKGTVDLPQQHLDYRLNVTALGSPFGSDALEMQQKIGGHIPIKISGTFDNLKIFPDLEEVTKSLGKEQLKEQVQKVIGKDVNDTLKKLGNFLRQ